MDVAFEAKLIFGLGLDLYIFGFDTLTSCIAVFVRYLCLAIACDEILPPRFDSTNRFLLICKYVVCKYVNVNVILCNLIKM